MATGTSTNFSPHVIGSTVVELSRSCRTGALFSVRISTRSNGVSARQEPRTEGPSCLFVGPIESASKETLEALYRQAREAYYNGKPLIVDDMFDRVELKLRFYGSKDVVKYPRCSLRQQSTYADAETLPPYCKGIPKNYLNMGSNEEDPSQVFALASVWLLFLAFGSSACLVPVVYTTIQAYQDTFGLGFSNSTQTSALEFLATMNGILSILLGTLIGYPVASASVGALQGLWKNDLVALKGACPNCGEEVFAFVRSNKSIFSPHRAECHVCESSIEFRTKVEKSISRLGRRWVYGRIYLIRQRGRRRNQIWT